jgi:HK97 gp10 family phage protein
VTAKIEWVNESQWAAALAAHFDDWARQFKINIKDVAALAEREAKLRAPVRTGRLRNGITGRTEETTAILTNDVPYAPHVEFGTRHTRAQPHMRPGMEAAIAAWVREMTQGLK